MSEFSLKKKLLVLAAVLSVITAFLPIFKVKGVGVALSIPKEYSLPIPLMPTIYGLGIIISAIAIVAFLILRIKPGYAIAAVVDFAISMVGLIDLANKAKADPYLLFDQVGNAMSSYDINEVVTAPGFYVLIIVSVMVLCMTLVNFLDREVEE